MFSRGHANPDMIDCAHLPRVSDPGVLAVSFFDD
jgi:hypothetical protein